METNACLSICEFGWKIFESGQDDGIDLVLLKFAKRIKRCRIALDV